MSMSGSSALVSLRVPLVGGFEKNIHAPTLEVTHETNAKPFGAIQVAWGEEAQTARMPWPAHVNVDACTARIKKATTLEREENLCDWVCIVAAPRRDSHELDVHELARRGEQLRREAQGKDAQGDRAGSRHALQEAARACRTCLQALHVLHPTTEAKSSVDDEDAKAARTAAMCLVRSLEHIGGDDAQEELRAVCAPLVAKGLLPFDDPLQRPAVLIRGLVPTQPWWRPTDVPMAVHLASLDWKAMRAEVLAALDAARAGALPPSAPSRQASDDGWRHTAATMAPGVNALSEGWRRIVAAGAWTELPLFAGHGVVESNCKLVPRTAHGIGTAPDATEVAFCGAGECIVSVLRPGTRLRPHCGPSNNRLTCHLALQVPPERRRDDGSPACAIRVGDAPPRAWREGEVLVFDDSFEHEVWYEPDPSLPNGGPDRVIALCHCWHPQISKDAFRFETAEAVLKQSQDLTTI